MKKTSYLSSLVLLYSGVGWLFGKRLGCKIHQPPYRRATEINTAFLSFHCFLAKVLDISGKTKLFQKILDTKWWDRVAGFSVRVFAPPIPVRYTLQSHQNDSRGGRRGNCLLLVCLIGLIVCLLFPTRLPLRKLRQRE